MQTIFFLNKTLLQRWLHRTTQHNAPISGQIFSAKRYSVQHHYLSNRRYCNKPISQRKLGLMLETDLSEISEHTEESDEESH